MFLCPPEYRTHNRLLDKLFPVAKGGGHWTSVIKQSKRPMFAVTLLQDLGLGPTEITLIASDAEAFWTLSNLGSATKILSVDCISRTHLDPSWRSREVAEVWTLRGHEVHVAYLQFAGEPSCFADAYTLAPVDAQDRGSWTKLFEIG